MSRPCEARSLLRAGPLLLCSVALASPASAQPAAGRDAAPVDLTGYWVSLITQEWPQRMLTPPKGDHRYIPLNEAGRAEAALWNPENDDLAGNECRGYAAPAIMWLPSRLHITWQDDVTLRVDIDTGMQTRLFHFGDSQALGPPTWQGHSVARWEHATDESGSATAALGGALHVDTTHLRAGYLQKNGVPFSDETFMTEYLSLIAEGGREYLLVQIFVEDPRYLSDHWVRTAIFRREPSGDSWSPTPCSAY